MILRYIKKYKLPEKGTPEVYVSIDISLHLPVQLFRSALYFLVSIRDRSLDSQYSSTWKDLILPQSIKARELFPCFLEPRFTLDVYFIKVELEGLYLTFLIIIPINKAISPSPSSPHIQSNSLFNRLAIFRAASP